MLLVTVKTDHKCKVSNVAVNWGLLVLVSHVAQLLNALFGVAGTRRGARQGSIPF
jgi:uncharacterized membrane protein YuzA (DUF378 family)